MNLRRILTLSFLALSLWAAGAIAGGAGFRDSRHLHQHFLKHGMEFGSVSQQQYLGLAQALRDARPAGKILEMRRGDGRTCRFDRGSGAFMVFDSDGTIRTFFRPRDGERYFRRQAYRLDD